MDVNETLANIRTWSASVIEMSELLDRMTDLGAESYEGTSRSDAQTYHDSAALMLAHAVQDLDGWIGKGGFLPAAWSAGK